MSDNVSNVSVLISLDADILRPSNSWSGRPALTIPEDECYPHINVQTERMYFTLIVDNPDAARWLAFALNYQADVLERRRAERAVAQAVA